MEARGDQKKLGPTVLTSQSSSVMRLCRGLAQGHLEVILVRGGRVLPTQRHRHTPRHPDRPLRDDVLSRVGGEHSHAVTRADEGREPGAQLQAGSGMRNSELITC